MNEAIPVSRDLVCYCFDLDASQIQGDPTLVGFIEKKVRAHECACEIRNPSAKCCLPQARALVGLTVSRSSSVMCCAEHDTEPENV